MRLLGTSLFVLVFFAAADNRTADTEKIPAPKFTVGKETTYVTGPLDKSGCVDYEAALNDRLAKGITSATNANVLIWKALGPRPEGKPMIPEFYRRLGIEEPPERGVYFVGLGTHVKEQLKLPPGEKNEDIYQELGRVTQRRWAAKDHRLLDGWLQVNEKHLTLVIEATKRPDYYNPLVTRRTEKGPGVLIAALLPSVQKCRELASALAARAMLRLNEGKLDDAWQDLLACHRLGRLVGRGGTLIEGLVGIAIDQITSNADVAFLDRAQLSSKKALACLRDLRQLPTMSPMADKVDLCERFIVLESMMLIHRQGLGYLKGLTDGSLPKRLDPKVQRALADIDWDPALSTANNWFDRMAAAMRLKECADREKKLNQLEEELKKMKNDIDMAALNELFLGKKAADKTASKLLGDVLVSQLLPPVRKVQQAADRTEQVQRNLHVAFALAAYRGDHERYPMTLAVLAPKYLEQVPGDLFSGKELIYRPTETGYLLYSVGVNGKDDGGRWTDDDPPGDDLRVRLPLPELKR